jgi:phage shock protein C
MNKQLFRSRENRMIAGVCGGVAEYFNIDPTIVRIIWVLFTLTYGLGLIAYIVGAIIIPERNLDNFNQGQNYGYSNNSKDTNHSNENQSDFANKAGNKNTNFIIGGVFIVIGLILTANQIFKIDFKLVWPIVLILIGGFVIFRSGRKV